jgi:hypothetical protein
MSARLISEEVKGGLKWRMIKKEKGIVMTGLVCLLTVNLWKV